MSTELINFYRQAEAYFFRGLSTRYMALGKGATAYMIGGTELNFIYITEDLNDLEKTLIKGKQFYDQDSLSFDVIIPQELCTSEVEYSLSSMGYPGKNTSVSMVLNLNEFLIDKNIIDDDETVVKEHNNQLNEWMMPLVGAFESTFDDCLNYATAHENAIQSSIHLRHFSLHKQGKPITSITLSMQESTARVDDVGTLPEFQGKGYATHLMNHVLSEAKQQGARHCFLEASESGLGVYQKLGFESLFKNNIY